jgi:Transport and Golgi organisation 2
MCTVTYVPSTSGYFLTSNRDEKNTRAKALAPATHIINDVALIFPKDADKGGTWITLKENGDSLCLLNGAFENFTDTGNYKISRGKIVLQIAASNNLIKAFDNSNLLHTAPFTLVIVCKKRLFECRWDGIKKHCKQLDNSIAHIWSSATLYDTYQQNKRLVWFEKWQRNNPVPSQKDLFNFHKNTGDGNVEDDLIMNRNNTYFTVSITGIAVNNEACLMQYEDIIQHEHYNVTFEYDQIVS